MLVCPLTKTRLVLSADRTELISVAAHLAFPIRDGVPMLSLDEARDVESDEMRVHFPPTAARAAFRGSAADHRFRDRRRGPSARP